ncbi:MAG: branched-chain amino acid transport system permease protein [Frankiales bacterium]|nr:branched-chain amino acid transport system permease protein [Frankiales bacterium]
MTQFFQQLSDGVVLGALYALIALGYTMVYGIVQLINFAHGEIFMVGAFGGYTIYHYLLPDNMPALVALPIVLVASMITSGVLAAIVERLAYRPLRNAPRLAPLITAIGVSIALQEVIRLFYPNADRGEPFPQLFPNGQVHFGGVSESYVNCFLVVLSVVLMLALRTFVLHSATGRAMRATAQDPDTARLMGINIDRIIVTTFVLGGLLAGAAGTLQGMVASPIDFQIGFIAGLKAFTAAVLGGIGNITGAVLGGFVLGIVEALATQYVPNGSALKDAFAFVVLILVLVFRPTGLLGESVRARA